MSSRLHSEATSKAALRGSLRPVVDSCRVVQRFKVGHGSKDWWNLAQETECFQTSDRIRIDHASRDRTLHLVFRHSRRDHFDPELRRINKHCSHVVSLVARLELHARPGAELPDSTKSASRARMHPQPALGRLGWSSQQTCKVDGRRSRTNAQTGNGIPATSPTNFVLRD
jgi:hypothetical protein